MEAAPGGKKEGCPTKRLLIAAVIVLTALLIAVSVVAAICSDGSCRRQMSESLPPSPPSSYDIGDVRCVTPPEDNHTLCLNVSTPSDLSALPARELPFFGQLFVHGSGSLNGTGLVSPVSWVNWEKEAAAFPRWTVKNAKCLAVNFEVPHNATLGVIDCGSSHSILLFERSPRGVTIHPMANTDYCFTAQQSTVSVSKCAAITTQEFVYDEYEGPCNECEPSMAIRPVDSSECLLPDWSIISNQFHAPLKSGVRLRDCKLAYFGLIKGYDEREMVLRLTPTVNNNNNFHLGETYMGNPGVHLPVDAVPKYLVEYPWADDYCDAPKPLYVDSSSACPADMKRTDPTGHTISNILCESTEPGPDGEHCNGFCEAVSEDRPCSCGTLSCPGCMIGLGYDAMTSEFLPDGCMFVGCQEDLDLDPSTPGTAYAPLIIPGGLNIRTCPNNVIDGMQPWTEVAQLGSSSCAVDAACADEPHKGTMNLSGRNITFCCPGETHNPFSALSLGYFGVMPEKAHWNNVDGKRDGVYCDQAGCTYHPSCACPLSVPSLNIRVSGPSTKLDPIFVPAAEAYTYNATEGTETAAADIVIAPKLHGDSIFHAYAVSIGSDDSFHVGNNVNLNPPGMMQFVESCKASSICSNRSMCSQITMDPYAGYGGPKMINPSGEWDVAQPPKSLFDDRKIFLAPRVTDGKLRAGPIFIGHPGHTYVGDNPDLRGIFKNVVDRPATGPGSSPGGTTNDGTEILKAFFQCKDDLSSATEWDPRIWY